MIAYQRMSSAYRGAHGLGLHNMGGADRLPCEALGHVFLNIKLWKLGWENVCSLSSVFGLVAHEHLLPLQKRRLENTINLQH